MAMRHLWAEGRTYIEYTHVPSLGTPDLTQFLPPLGREAVTITIVLMKKLRFRVAKELHKITQQINGLILPQTCPSLRFSHLYNCIFLVTLTKILEVIIDVSLPITVHYPEIIQNLTTSH